MIEANQGRLEDHRYYMGQDGNKNEKNVLYWKVDIFRGEGMTASLDMYATDAMFGVDEIDLYRPHQSDINICQLFIWLYSMRPNDLLTNR